MPNTGIITTTAQHAQDRRPIRRARRAHSAGTAATADAATTAGNSGSSAVPPTLTGIKAQAATESTDRVDHLNGAIAKVIAAKGLGSTQGTLVSYLGTDVSPLQQLNRDGVKR